MSFKVVLKRQGPVQQNIFVATNVATNVTQQNFEADFEEI